MKIFFFCGEEPVGHRNAFFLETVCELGSVKGVGLAELDIPKQDPVGIRFFHLVHKIGMAVIVGVVDAATGCRIEKE